MARKVVEAAESGEWRDLTAKLTITGNSILLFDSAACGETNPEDIEASTVDAAIGYIGPGTYTVSTTTTPDETALIRLRRC